MDIIFYAGSLRPGGGLTVAKIMIEALAEDKSNRIVVYTGAKDSSQALSSVFDAHNNLQEKQFLHTLNSELRYALSKIFFLPKSLFKKNTLLISVNYYIPSFYKQFVYHLNLLSFMRQKGDRLPKKLKEFDAALACRFATFNVFESDYLKNTAEQYTSINIQNPKRLYIGVDPEFYLKKEADTYQNNAGVLLVSSPQPHKDNHTAIDALKKLVKNHNSVDWKLTIVGGQTIEQWSELLSYAKEQGVDENITLLGPVDKTHLSKLMSQSLCLITTSKIESFCMVALEAMASKCPAIVTNETSMPESVGDAAIVVNAGSSSQFSQAIYSLYHNTDVREKLVFKGEKRAEKFTYKSFKIALLKIIETLPSHGRKN